MGILDTVNARLAVKKEQAELTQLSPLERVSKAIQEDVQKGCAKCHPSFPSATDENTTKDHLDTDVGNQINPKKRKKATKGWAVENQLRDPSPDSNAGWKKQQAAQAAAKPKKPYLG
jgi:hypothetical protein